jgi:hypothetical protein
MLTVLDIFFQSGEFIIPDNSWWQELLNTMLGAGIGSGVTIWALYRTFRQDKIKDEKNRIEIQIEKIKYFKSLISNTISDLKAQTGFVKTHSETVTKDPLNLPLLEIRTFNDLERLVHKINQEEYYHAYLGQFNSRNESIEEFRKIYALLDFFHASIRTVQDMFKSAQSYDYARKIKYKEQFESMTDFVATRILIGSALVNYVELYKFIDDAVVKFHPAHTDKTNIKTAYDFVELLKSGVVKYGQQIPEINNLLIQLKNLTISYSDIMNQNKFMAEEFIDQHKYLKENLEKFETLTKRLTNY